MASVSRVRRRRVGPEGEVPSSLRHMLQLPPPFHCVCVRAPAQLSWGKLREFLVWESVCDWYPDPQYALTSS